MTAKDLLYKILDYQYLWGFLQNKDSKPAKLRLEQIELLLDVFGLTKRYINPLVQIKYSILGNKKDLDRAKYLNKLTNLEYFLQGEFLPDREKDKNTELSEKIIKTIASLYPYMTEHINHKSVDIELLFEDLLTFRQEVYKLTYHNREGTIDGFSAGLRYSFYLQHKLKVVISENLEEIDEVLWAIIDPTRRDVEMSMLINKYKYIDHDFNTIDLNWRIENY